jgi:hypothetical protein
MKDYEQNFTGDLTIIFGKRLKGKMFSEEYLLPEGSNGCTLLPTVVLVRPPELTNIRRNDPNVTLQHPI